MKQSIAIVSIIILLCLSACGKTQSAMDKVSITLDWTPNTNHTGIYVAQELGYFADQNLEVEIQQPGQSITDQIVATGKSQFGVSYQENVIRARSEGIPLVSIAAVIQHNTSGFAALQESGITSPQDFAGKRYGSWDSPSELAILESVMQQFDSSIDQVEIVSGVYDFFSTIGKDADFEWIYYGWDGVIAEQRGIKINYMPLRELNPVFDYYTPILISSEDYLRHHPDTAKAFLAAVKKGYEYCIDNPEQAADILIKHVPELNPDQVKLSMAYLAEQYLSDAEYWGYQRSDVWHGFANWMSDEALIKEPITVSDAYTNEYLTH